MSQPNGLETANATSQIPQPDQNKKKSFTWYLQPWKWKTQKTRPQVEIEPERRNSGTQFYDLLYALYSIFSILEPTTPTNARENISPAVNGDIHETSPAEDMIHHQPIIPKLVRNFII